MIGLNLVQKSGEEALQAREAARAERGQRVVVKKHRLSYVNITTIFFVFLFFGDFFFFYVLF